jgi:hypothetical protein
LEKQGKLNNLLPAGNQQKVLSRIGKINTTLLGTCFTDIRSSLDNSI